MDNEYGLRDQIFNNMQLKTTEELMLILEENDREEWSTIALEVVRQILIQRTGKLPDTPIEPYTRPIEWETINWQAISTKYDSQSVMSKAYIALVSVMFSACILFGIVLLILPPANNSRSAGAFFALFGVGLLGLTFWSYYRTQTAKRIVAQARVFLKDPISRGRGSLYDVGFAIKSAFVLAKDGTLTASDDWKGHHTFTIPAQIYNKINEQDIVDFIFLSNGNVLGLLNGFKNN